MTICVATVFTWNHGTMDQPDLKPGVIIAADRMFTDGGLRIEYEGAFRKRLSLPNNVWIFVAGSMTVHTAVIRRLLSEIEGQPPYSDKRIADAYVRHLNAHLLEEAERLYLAPFGLTLQTFQSSQQTLDSGLVNDLNRHLAEHSQKVEFDALVVGVSQTRPTLISIDRTGLMTFHDDIGFAAIGVGDIHAASHCMQSEYSRFDKFAAAVWRTFHAKKRAEVAPGVGRATDVLVVLHDGCFMPSKAVMEFLEAAWESHLKNVAALHHGVTSGLDDANLPFFEVAEGAITGVDEVAQDAPKADSAD